jgi:fibrillarin-like pre-rRNA processing protein
MNMLYVKKGNKLFTNYKNKERLWDPTTSKLAAAILKGLKMFEFTKESRILYLGASTGTTVSHLSDMMNEKGIIYAIEFSERVFRSLLELSAERSNIAPLLMDARTPEKYAWIEECDIVYMDIAQPDQTQIALRNADAFLKKGGILYIVVKSQSIDVTKHPKQVYEQEKNKTKAAGYDVLEVIDLEPYEDKHAMIVAKKK